jgi:colicin import membrane protein
MADRWSALIWAIVIHLLLFVVLSFGLSSSKEPPATAALKPVIQASAVNEAQVMEPYRRRLEEEAAQKRRVAEQKRQAAEKKRRAEEARRKAAAEKKRQAEEAARRKAAEQKRLAEQKRKQEAEKARLAALEKQRKIEAERKAAEARQQAEAERKRIEAQQRREAEARLKAQMAAEAERMAQEEQRIRSAQLSRLQDQYVADITNKVQRNWLRPPDSRGTLCSVLINQIPGGEIVGVRVTDCDGDVAFQRSVEAAVRKASPLPQPPEPELFQREIEFVFRPDR